ncbi:hypothetical protein QLQ12_34725 [Actinoplanes sp. NEAU-A12]|uniref:Uncharacterized protein n=1 Tax=Actinoplanes sandaracinus TaxID=3045177 RepID=A0ABT6WVL4_9ACTN|nr:hypothetical protein [Actinoplanes sandaracinus]MDI6103782.1 hypothetical protein [Actinoplanes sandaracinus]
MRTDLGDGWSIDLPPGDGTLTTSRLTWRCATADSILTTLAGEVPPGATGRTSESGRGGVGVRAAWFYPGRLLGYHFIDGDCLETDLAGPDPTWTVTAWRSVRWLRPAPDRSPTADDHRRSPPRR